MSSTFINVNSKTNAKVIRGFKESYKEYQEELLDLLGKSDRKGQQRKHNKYKP